MLIVFYLERTNQLNLLPDKDLVDLCPPIEPYQVTKNHKTQPNSLKVLGFTIVQPNLRSFHLIGKTESLQADILGNNETGHST